MSNKCNKKSAVFLARPSVLGLFVAALFLVNYVIAVNGNAAGLAQLDAAKFASLDSSPEIVKFMDLDRMSKVLILQSLPNSGNLINHTVLDKAISDLVESEEAVPAIVRDLAAGDARLRQTLLQVLSAFNVGPNEANGLVIGWSENTPEGNSSLRAVLYNAIKRPEVMQRLRVYFMENGVEWVRTTKALADLVSGRDKEIGSALAIAIANATGSTLIATQGTIQKASDGDVTAKWLLSSNIAKVMGVNGAMAHVMRSQQLTGDSLYEKGWSRVAKQIAADPMMVTEYAHRTYLLTPLYDGMCSLLINAMMQNDTETLRAIGSAMVRLSTIPGSRFEWMSNEILGPGGAAAYSKLRTEKEKNTELDRIVSRLSALMQTDQAWCDLILWHLTRVGEAAVLTTRNELQSTIGEDDAMARDLIRVGAPFGSEFDSKMSAAGAYSYYQGGGPSLRAKVDSGEVEVPALRTYMKAFTRVLSTDDDAWDLMFIESQRDSKHFVADILCQTIDRSSAASRAWLQTVYGNDDAMKQGFIQWLVSTGAATSPQTANLWIESVNSAVTSGSMVGNTEVARLKASLIEFIHSAAGWPLINQRIAAESYAFPNRIRSLMVDRAVSSPSEFWPIYRKLVATDGAITSLMHDNVKAYVRATTLPTLILDEAAAQNPYATDASSVVWDGMLAKPTLPKELERLLREGFTMNLAYGTANMAMIDVVQSKAGWDLVAPYAAAYYQLSPSDQGLQSKVVESFSNSSMSEIKLMTRLLDDSRINALWRSRVLSLVKFLGKAPPVASAVRKDSAMEKEWREEMGTDSSVDPVLLESLVNALSMRRVGDDSFGKQVKDIRKDLAKMVFCDRILIEQILADKNADYRKALLSQVRERFGTYVEQEWK